MTLFVTAPACRESCGAGAAALWGGLFGPVACGARDLTNLATLAGLPHRIAPIGMAWVWRSPPPWRDALADMLERISS